MRGWVYYQDSWLTVTGLRLDQCWHCQFRVQLAGHVSRWAVSTGGLGGGLHRGTGTARLLVGNVSESAVRMPLASSCTAGQSVHTKHTDICIQYTKHTDISRYPIYYNVLAYTSNICHGHCTGESVCSEKVYGLQCHVLILSASATTQRYTHTGIYIPCMTI